MILILEIATCLSILISIYGAYLSMCELFNDRYLSGKLEFALVLPMVSAFWLVLILGLSVVMYALVKGIEYI